MDRFVPLLALLWAGIVIGGSLIVAPAKFQAPSLTLTTALEVGQAQIHWLSVVEVVLCVGIILIIFVSSRFTLVLFAIPITAFALQWKSYASF